MNGVSEDENVNNVGLKKRKHISQSWFGDYQQKGTGGSTRKPGLLDKREKGVVSSKSDSPVGLYFL